jgi:hypothetical protein
VWHDIVIPQTSERRKDMPAAQTKRVRAPIDPNEAVSRFRDPKVQARFRKAMGQLAKKTDPLIEAVRSTERLDESDYAIRINTKG